MNPKLLKFWRHADSIYKLLMNTWHCTCRSCASLWLQQHPKELVQMSIVIPFCHGRRALQIELSDSPKVLQLAAPQKPNFRSNHSASAHTGALPTVSILAKTSVLAVRSQSGRNTTTTTCTTQAATITPGLASPSIPFLQHQGLCALLATPTANSQDCLGRITEGDDEYAVYPTVEKVSCAKGTSLADLLRPDATLNLNRVQRYGIALTLASSHLQLHSTPWLKGVWASDDILFPIDDNNLAALHGEPYIISQHRPCKQH